MKIEINKTDVKAILWSYLGVFILMSMLIEDLYGCHSGYAPYYKCAFLCLSLFVVIFVKK